jgi:hypothetical protein
MTAARNRREFLADVGRGMLVAAVGSGMAADLGLAQAAQGDSHNELSFGDMEPLVRLMQETPVDRLLPALTGQLKSGTELRRLVAAAALANARTFGGEDYVGFHTMMALAPAYHMARELPPERQPLPVFKVLYRNTNRIQEHGGRASEVLHAVSPGESSTSSTDRPAGERMREDVRRRDVAAAEKILAALVDQSVEAAFNELMLPVQDGTEVHRIVLPYRAWDLLDLIGHEQALTLLRQSVHYCVRMEDWAARQFDEPRSLLPKLLDEHHLLGRALGDKAADDQWVDRMCQTIFTGTPAQAAEAAAAALADGIAPSAVGEAVALAANQLILRDIGRTARDEVTGKPMGSVHGDSIGVHACDSANAWRNIARVSNARNTYSCLILGAYQAARDRVDRGGDFLHWQPLPLPMHMEQVKTTDAAALLREIETAIRGNLQAHACAAVQKYGDLGHPPRPLFDLMLKYAISEDGSLHAEKFYRTVSEEFAASRPAFRWRHVVALARVTASEYGRPAPGYAEARELLKV